MTKKKAIKTSVVALVFSLAFLGLHFTTESKMIGGERINVSLVSLGTQAKAYCQSETPPATPANDGGCTGDFSDPSTRCLEVIDPSNINCRR